MLGRYAAELVIDRYVKAKPNANGKNQFFHIRKVSKPINGMFTVSCEHISYAPFRLSGADRFGIWQRAGRYQRHIDRRKESASARTQAFSVATTDITLSSSIALTNAFGARCARRSVRLRP